MWAELVELVELVELLELVDLGSTQRPTSYAGVMVC